MQSVSSLLDGSSSVILAAGGDDAADVEVDAETSAVLLLAE